jgi:hypothetical protein
MSCDGNTAAHASNLAASPQIAAALGGGDPAAAKEAILHIHELATTRAERVLRNRGTPTGLAKIQARGADAAAAEATVAAFQEITASGLNVPAHGDAHPRYGVPLPKLATQYGWQAVQQTVEAVRGRQTLPAIAQEVLAGAQTTRRMTSIVEAGGKNHYRCGECGRYRSPTDHTCPMTANAQALGGKLTRRLGVPRSAYPAGALDALIAQARQGDIVMRHGLTGEIVSVSLDSLPSALAGGFVPDTWRRERSLALAQMSNGRVVPVLDAQDLSVLPAADRTGHDSRSLRLDHPDWRHRRRASGRAGPAGAASAADRDDQRGGRAGIRHRPLHRLRVPQERLERHRDPCRHNGLRRRPAQQGSGALRQRARSERHYRKD